MSNYFGDYVLRNSRVATFKWVSLGRYVATDARSYNHDCAGYTQRDINIYNMCKTIFKKNDSEK